MSDDVRPILDAWPYDPDDLEMVRRVTGPDGLVRLQMRVELGLLELRTSGRPDGDRPHGYPSLLAYHLDNAPSNSRGDGGRRRDLDGEACEALRQELVQYYHRRVCWMRLGEFGQAAEDAYHSLDIIDLLRARAASRDDWRQIERYRIGVVCDMVRARVYDLIERNERPEALQELDRGIDLVASMLDTRSGGADSPQDSDELADLRHLHELLMGPGHVPTGVRVETETERLARELDHALRNENYEEAAQLRDKLLRLRQ